jgi:DNA-binding NarL/FixJ family response regulator
VRSTAVGRCKIIVVEVHPLVGGALCRLLAQDRELEVLLDARTVEERVFAARRPDLLIVDMDGLETQLEEMISLCRAVSPATRIIVLTSNPSEQSLQRCLACDVDGYLPKDISPSDLIEACKTVAAGATYFDPTVAGGLLRRLNDSPEDGDLTLRETEILRLIGRGMSNREIGERLVISEKTVKNAVSRIFAKLGMTARTQAAVYALRNGIT